MAARESSGGVGCFGIVVGLVVLGWIIEHIKVVLTVAVLVAVIALVGWLANVRAEREQVRRRCPVCSGWNSVIMTDLDAPTRRLLCPHHAQRLLRIERLEAALLDPDVL